MTHRWAGMSLSVALLALLTPGCSDAGPDVGVGAPLPDRPPEVAGVVAQAGTEPGPVLTAASDGYYEGMLLTLADPVVVGPRGDVVEVSDLQDGDTVEVWVEDACAESFPVQCGIEVVRVLP